MGKGEADEDEELITERGNEEEEGVTKKTGEEGLLCLLRKIKL